MRADREPESSFEMIRIPLPEDQWAGIRDEGVWAQPLSRGRFRVDNIPFYAYGLSVGDVVTACPTDNGTLWLDEVVGRSGHSTYRIILRKDADVTSDEFRAAWGTLEDLGCTYEVASPRLLAVDVPAAASVDAAYSALDAGEASGLWEFEEGHCGHRTR